jgi:hypothetical protein
LAKAIELIHEDVDALRAAQVGLDDTLLAKAQAECEAAEDALRVYRATAGRAKAALEELLDLAPNDWYWPAVLGSKARKKAGMS